MICMKTVIFDWSGVVKDAFKSHLWIVNRIFDKYGIKKITPEELREEWEEPYMIFFNRYLPDMTMEEEQILYKEGITHPNCPEVGACLGVVELIKKLKSSGFRLVLISADFPESVFGEIKRFGLEDAFDQIMTQIHNKTESVKQIVEDNNLDRKSTFIVGDSDNEISAAKAAGIASIAVTWGLASRQKLASKSPNYVVDSVVELEDIINDN